MSILMVDLERKLTNFGDCRGSNLDIESKGNSRDKGYNKPSSNAITTSQQLFNMEVIVDVKHYEGEVNSINLIIGYKN